MAKSIMLRSPTDRCIAWTSVAFSAITVGEVVMYSAAKLIPRGHPSVIIAVALLVIICQAIGLLLLCFSGVLAWRAVTATPRHIVFEYVRALRIPISIMLANVVVFNVVVGLTSDEIWTELVFNAVRIVAIVLAGWTLARRGSSLLKSAAAGLLLLFLDHVAIKGGWFLLTLQWGAFSGVLTSFSMFAVVAMAIAAMAAFVGKSFPPSNPTVETDAHEAARGSP